MAKEKEIGLIYAGQRLGADKKMFHRYILTTDKNDYISFSKKVGRLEIIGNLLTCIDKGGGTYGKFNIVGKLSDGDDNYGDVDSWFVEQRAAMESLRQIKLNKQERSESLEHKIKNLQKDMAYLNTKQRNDVALWVYTQLIK